MTRGRKRERVGRRDSAVAQDPVSGGYVPTYITVAKDSRTRANPEGEPQNECDKGDVVDKGTPIQWLPPIL
jgi:hypothetical protein